MDRNKLVLFVNTLKHLKLKQIYYQVFFKIRNKFFKKDYTKELSKEPPRLLWNNSFSYPVSFTGDNNFVFLNQSHQFEELIDWNYSGYGKLWTYNLNYFDFLNQKNMSKKQGLTLINDFIKNDKYLKDGKEPYPISLRGINWIKFLSEHKIKDRTIDQSLRNHYEILVHNLEYHLLGNHLLENGYSLLFGAYYFKDEHLYQKAKKILISELDEQVLEDGGHFELSPMYHQILLHRLLDCINLVSSNSWKGEELKEFLLEKAREMLSWLKTVTFDNGNIPMVNDSAYDIAPTSDTLFAYAKDIQIQFKEIELKDSGYRMLRKEVYELFVDVGHIGPSYQPGHAHSDTFNFELYVRNNPFIVDPGISTYEKNELRLQQRQTASHNTVKIGDFEQSDVWDGFRVAKRAKITSLKEDNHYVEATHDGYKNIKMFHSRKFTHNDTQIEIEDKISGLSEKKHTAFFHFHPTINSVEIDGNTVHFPEEHIDLFFEGKDVNIMIESYDYSVGFNKTKKAKKMIVDFSDRLNTQIKL